MGPLFMSVAAATYFWGPLAQPMQPARWLHGEVALGFRSFPAYRSFLILCGAALVTVLWLGLRRPRIGVPIRAAVDNLRMAQSVRINTSLLFPPAFSLGSGPARAGGRPRAALLSLRPSSLPWGRRFRRTTLLWLSAALVLGEAGIVPLGPAAFFGPGAYPAGILAANGWGEPITGLLAAALAAGLIGLASGFIVLRTTGLALLMQTLVVATLLREAANKASWITGGADGLQGMEVSPIFGLFRFDMFRPTGYLYCLIGLFLCRGSARRIVHCPFCRPLTGNR